MRVTTTILKNAIKEYTERMPNSVAYVEDPRVSGTYAIRAMLPLPNGHEEVFDFLLIHTENYKTLKDLVLQIEEVEFETWPPASGELKFFF